MTSTTPTTTGSPEGYIFQRDAMGRVRVPAARREALLDEFERGGVSGQAFAAMVGVKYSTFATWRQDRRRAARAGNVAVRPPAPAPAPSASSSSSAAGTMRWLEAVVAAAPTEAAATSAPAALRLSLPGGATLEISAAGQAPLAAALLRALEENRGR